MKKIFLLLTFFLSVHVLLAQETKLYNPDADAKKDLEKVIAQAKAEHKFVLIQAGGNWCKWCIEFARFAKADPKMYGTN